MSDEWAYILIATLFPVVFVGMMLFISTVLGTLSGWFALQRRYPAGDEPVILRLRHCSGSMGLGVALNGVLTLSVSPSGLRVGIWRLIGPFQKPFFVPWQEIHTEPKAAFFFTPMTRLSFGNPVNGTLKIDTRTWQRLTTQLSSAPGIRGEPVSMGRTGRGLLLQWACTTLIAGSFFYLASQTNAPAGGLPLLACFGFPGLVFGIGHLISFIRQR